MPVGPTRTLAEFVANLRYEDLPARIRERASDLVLDAFASGLAGRHGAETGQIRAVAQAMGGDGDLTVIGERPLALAGAAFLNAYLITAVTVCDVYRPSLCHVSPEVVPVAMAISEQMDSSGRDFLLAVAAGMEVTTRVGLGLHYPSFRARGWHSPGVIGPFGAAAAAGKLLGLDADQLCNAFGLAGAQAAGTFAAWGTPAVKFHQAHGALAGLMAALLAREAFSAAPEILAAPDGGLLNTYSDGGRPDAVLADLGARWELEQISLRPWPVASSLQAEVTALLALAEAHGLRPEGIKRVRIGLSPTVYQMHGAQPWDGRFHAMLSARYVAAVVLHDRRCWLEQFALGRLRAADVNAFAENVVEVEEDRETPDTGALVEVTMTNGTRHADRRAFPRGDAADPLSRAEIEAKFHAASADAMSPDLAADLLKLLSRLEDVDRMSDVLYRLRAPMAALPSPLAGESLP
jgi:2-methylcitrate dehydratase PrpD